MTETPLGIIGLLEESTKKFNLKVAMQIKSQEKARMLSYKKLRKKVIRVSSNLIGLGIQIYDRVAILSENRPEQNQPNPKYVPLSSALGTYTLLTMGTPILTILSSSMR